MDFSLKSHAELQKAEKHDLVSDKKHKEREVADQSEQYQNNDSSKKINILMELRPALEGFAGIPQETRLLFSAFRDFSGIEPTGLINHYKLPLRKTVRSGKSFDQSNVHKKIDAISRHIISHRLGPEKNILGYFLRMYRKEKYFSSLRLATFFGLSQKITHFYAEGFEDFIWSSLFSKTLPASEFDKILSSRFATLQAPYAAMHRVGMKAGTFLRHPRIATKGYDIFLSQTPFPGRVSRRTQLVVRYHDAIPIYLPHTIPETRFHQRSHYTALRGNAKTAHFACTSEASRTDLLRLFPSLEERSTVIHDMVSQSYFEERAPRERIAEIIRSRIEPTTEPGFLTSREKMNFYSRMTDPKSLRYLVMVSTIEPRKNHGKLIGAWEILRSRLDPDLKLIIVGKPGWGNANVLNAMKSWQERGALFNLSAVPSADLRVLYNGAEAVVCPSVAEGFDLSGIEAMLCGGAVAASDIPVHREVYADACEYFNPYSALSAADAIERIIRTGQSIRRNDLIEMGKKFAKRYKTENIAPKWKEYFHFQYNLSR